MENGTTHGGQAHGKRMAIAVNGDSESSSKFKAPSGKEHLLIIYTHQYCTEKTQGSFEASAPAGRKIAHHAKACCPPTHRVTLGFACPSAATQREREREREREKMDSGDPSLLSPSGSSLLRKQLSRVSLCDSEDEEHHDASVAAQEEFVPSPLIPLKKQLELDKEDESLRRWKEQLLGGINLDQSDEKVEPEVEVVGLSILAKGRTDLNIPLPLSLSKTEVAFVLKEGSSYNLKFKFTVQHNLVSGLTYLNTVWRCGVQVDQTRTMLGTFSPQQEPYVHVLDEEITPAGFVALGVYTAKTKFVDDDGRCYLEADYSFEIRKDW